MAALVFEFFTWHLTVQSAGFPPLRAFARGFSSSDRFSVFCSGVACAIIRRSPVQLFRLTGTFGVGSAFLDSFLWDIPAESAWV